jgi:hypothetical protein
LDDAVDFVASVIKVGAHAYSQDLMLAN